MLKFALIGKNISQSLSPVLFNSAYKEYSFQYNLIECDNVETGISIFNSQEYRGANITSPFKADVMRYCDDHSELSQKAGVANLILREGQKIKSYNTDYYGVRTPLKMRNIKPGRAVIIGAGGASRAAILALKDSGMDVTIVNRTESKAQDLAKEFEISSCSLTEFAKTSDKYSLLIYTIDHPADELKNCRFDNCILFEANYKNPILRNKVCREYIPGIEWLIYQAIPSFRLFTASEPNVESMLKVDVNY